MMNEYQNLKTEVIEDIENVWDKIKSDPLSLIRYSIELKDIIWDILLQCRNLILNFIFKPENFSKYLQPVINFKDYPDDQIFHVIAEMIIHQTHYYTTEFLSLYRIIWNIDLDVFPTPYFSHEMLSEIILDMINFFHQREKEIQDILNIKHRISIRNRDKFGYDGFIIHLKPKPQIEYVYYGNLEDEGISEIQDENDLMEKLKNHPEIEKASFLTIPKIPENKYLFLQSSFKIIIELFIILVLFISSSLPAIELVIIILIGLFIGGFVGIIDWKIQPQLHSTQLMMVVFNWMWLMSILTYSIALLII